jgi:hypothetical protein
MLLDDWLSESEAATEIGKSVRTLRRRRKGMGPPFAHFGRTVKYRRSALSSNTIGWLRSSPFIAEEVRRCRDEILTAARETATS